MNTSRRKDILEQIRVASKDGKNVPWRESLPDISDGELDELELEGFIVQYRYSVKLTGVARQLLKKPVVRELTKDERARLLDAITLHGKSAKPATIINEVGMQNQRVRQCLRILEGEGLFDGFAK